eukprot:123446-Rhodomonas_salina.1
MEKGGYLEALRPNISYILRLCARNLHVSGPACSYLVACIAFPLPPVTDLALLHVDSTSALLSWPEPGPDLDPCEAATAFVYALE